MRATEPGGGVYTVRRRWWPWRWRQRVSAEPWNLDIIDGALSGADDVLGFFGLLAIGIVAIVLLPVLFLFLVTGVEWLVLLVVLPVALVGRLALGKHWTIEVRHDGLLWEVDGGSWRESAAALSRIAAQIQTGQVPAVSDAVS